MAKTDISKNEFENYPPAQRLFTHDNARRFACIELPGSQHAAVFSWRSDTIEPAVIVDSSGNAMWIGIDDHLAAITDDGQILFSLGLTSQLLTVELKEDTIVAICELQAVVVHSNGAIEAIVDFPDAVEDFRIANRSVLVSLMNGSVVEFSI